MLLLLIAYIIGGVGAGILAGWVGAGGGVIIIPMMILISKYQEIPANVSIHLAVSTSLSFIMINALYGSYKHYKSGHLTLLIVKMAVPTILIGTIIGTILGKFMSAIAIETIFTLTILTVLIKTFIRKKDHYSLEAQLPSKLSCRIMGLCTGVLASLVGIGGSGIVNPYMQHYHYPMKNCAATSTALAFPMGLFATVVTLLSSFYTPQLPNYTLGYLYLPAFIYSSAFFQFTAAI